jgi:acyl transferase domain-containing protein
LKPLHLALRDRDPVRAILRNTGVNQDGKTAGITLPNRHAQEALIRRVYEEAGLNPLDTTYIECHGTGTPAGDPLEASAVASVFSEGRPCNQPLMIGSIKSNIGHLEGCTYSHNPSVSSSTDGSRPQLLIPSA